MSRLSGASLNDAIDLTSDSPEHSRNKRPQPSDTPDRTPGSWSITRRAPESPSPSTSKRQKTIHNRSQSSQSSPSKKKSPRKKQDGEKRKRMFRDHAPVAFASIYERAMNQRFYVLHRQRDGTEACPEEIVHMTGSTGNVYKVVIAQQPSCDCPHAAKGNQCKHVVYVLAKVLHAPAHLVYQLALLSTELHQIFQNAPPITAPKTSENEDKKRKPIEGDCCICFSELSDSASSEKLVWCKAACGQNFHADCFNMWAKTKTGEATCPFCRSVWDSDGKGKAIAEGGIDLSKGREEEAGYINVRDQLPGVTGYRDTSSYHHWSPYRRRRRPWHERAEADLARYPGAFDYDDVEDEDYEED